MVPQPIRAVVATPDFAMPDLAMPDLATPDFAMPDLSIPDLAIPDLATFDLSRSDLAEPADFSQLSNPSVLWLSYANNDEMDVVLINDPNPPMF